MKSTLHQTLTNEQTLFYRKNDNDKLSIISKIHKTKYKFKAEQHGKILHYAQLKTRSIGFRIKKMK